MVRVREGEMGGSGLRIGVRPALVLAEIHIPLGGQTGEGGEKMMAKIDVVRRARPR